MTGNQIMKNGMDG